MIISTEVMLHKRGGRGRDDIVGTYGDDLRAEDRLSDLLGKDVPADGDEPFPHSRLNDAKGLRRLGKTFAIVTYAWLPVVISLGVGSVVLGRRLMIRNK